jgi:hypothetical protein
MEIWDQNCWWKFFKNIYLRGPGNHYKDKSWLWASSKKIYRLSKWKMRLLWFKKCQIYLEALLSPIAFSKLFRKISKKDKLGLSENSASKVWLHRRQMIMITLKEMNFC